MKEIYLTILVCCMLFPASTQISFVSENFYREVSSEGSYHLVKQGFDVNFYTPLIDHLKGSVSSCVIEEYLPLEEIQKIMEIEYQQREYSTQKTHYESQKKSFRKKNPFLLLEPFDYPGYDVNSLAYEIDSSNQSISISLLEVRLMNLDKRKIMGILALYQIFQGNKMTPVVFYQSPFWKQKKSKSVLLSYLEEKENDEYKQMKVLYQKLETDTLLEYKLNVLSSEKDWFTDAIEELDLRPEIRRSYYADNSAVDYGFYIKENDTVPLFSKTFNAKGLLVQQIFHNRFFYKEEKNRMEDFEKIDYQYDEKGLPVKVIYQKGTDLPVEYSVKFSRPDQLGNFTKMEIQNTKSQSTTEIYWYIDYSF